MYREIFAPILLSPYRPNCKRANLRLGEFYVAKNISVKTTASGRIQEGATPFAIVEGRK